MADISQITLPSGTTYDIKDTVARAGVSSGGTFVIAWAGHSTPIVANIPAGVVVKYNETNYTGTKEASANDLKKFILVAAIDQGSNQETLDIYDEYVVIDNGESANPHRYTWEKIGDTQIKLTAMVTGVTLNKQSTDFVTSYSDPGSATFLKKVTANTSKLATTTITGVSGSITASKVSNLTDQTTVSGFASDTSTDAFLKGWSVTNEVLTIGGAAASIQTTKQIKIDNDVTVPKAASSATRVATGGLDSDDSNGSTIATGVTISGSGYTGTALTSLGTKNTSKGLNESTSITVSHPS